MTRRGPPGHLTHPSQEVFFPGSLGSNIYGLPSLSKENTQTVKDLEFSESGLVLCS